MTLILQAERMATSIKMTRQGCRQDCVKQIKCGRTQKDQTTTLATPATLRLLFFACDCGRKQGVAYPSTSHTPTGTRKGEKCGKEVSLSFSKNCPLCPRPDNGRLHDCRKVKTHEKKKKRLQDVLAKDLISISELMKYIKNNQPNDTTNRNMVVQDIKGVSMHEK